MISLIEEISGLIVLTVLNEADRLGIELPSVKAGELHLKETEFNKIGVIYTIKGTLGDKLNNPDIKMMYNENFNKFNKPDINLLNVQVNKDYITLRLINIADKNK